MRSLPNRQWVMVLALPRPGCSCFHQHLSQLPAIAFGGFLGEKKMPWTSADL